MPSPGLEFPLLLADGGTPLLPLLLYLSFNPSLSLSLRVAVRTTTPPQSTPLNRLSWPLLVEEETGTPVR